jgi:UDP-glucuronate 4-epimerase
MNLCDLDGLKNIFSKHSISRVCHLAAQAGVRYSITHPLVYQKSNMEGFQNIIEVAKNNKVKNFVYASSSSVYGGNTKLPFAESDPVNNPISLYAATKRSNELIAHTYSHLFKLPTTGLRFFTVYGPWGRPDMALFIFTRAILEDRPIDVYNHGNMRRSFSYIDDIVNGIVKCIKKPWDYEILNLGNDNSASLMEYIEAIESSVGKSARKNMLPLQPGDVPQTVADLTHARTLIGFEAKTQIQEGIDNFVKWFREYYKI